MSDVGENTTVYDYSEYNQLEDNDFTPCNSSNRTDFGKLFLPVLYSLVFILGFIGNGLVVCVLVKHHNKANLTDICLFNLAVSDLLFIITLPLYAHYSVVGQWNSGDFMCRFAAVSHTTGFFSSIFFMIAMTLDRYVLIMHAVTLARYGTMRAGIALALLIWVLSLSVSLPAFIFTKVTNESYGLGCNYAPESYAWKLYNLYATNILGLLIPLLVMVACYSRIIPALVNLRSVKKHRAVKLIITIVVVFFLLWAPYNICLFLSSLKFEDEECNRESSLRLAVAVTEAFAYTHCCLNPFIYAFVGQKFMKRALLLLRNWVPWLPFARSRDLSDSSYRKRSVMSRSSDVTSSFIN